MSTLTRQALRSYRAAVSGRIRAMERARRCPVYQRAEFVPLWVKSARDWNRMAVDSLRLFRDNINFGDDS